MSVIFVFQAATVEQLQQRILMVCSVTLLSFPFDVCVSVFFLFNLFISLKVFILGQVGHRAAKSVCSSNIYKPSPAVFLGLK